MTEPMPRQRAEIRDFPGLVLDRDPTDNQDGASPDQRNMTCADMGKIQSRGGIRKVSFEDD